MHHFAILQLDRRSQSDLFLGGGFCERRHSAACDAQRCARNRPWKYRQAWYSVDYARLAGLRRQETVGVSGRYEGVLHLEVATPGAAKPETCQVS